MGILNLTVGNVGQSGQQPVWVYIDTNNTFTAVQAAGYLNDFSSQLNESYMALVTTRATPNATTIGTSIFDITKSGANWSLTAPSFGSTVTYTGSLTSGNLPKWNNTSGQLADSGIAVGAVTGTLGTAATKAASASGVSTVASVTGPTVLNHFALFSDTAGSISDAQAVVRSGAYATVVMASAAVTAGHVAAFADTAGSLVDGGVLGTAAAKAASAPGNATVSSVTAATVAGNTATFADTAGSLAAGYHLRAQPTSGAGGSPTFTVTDANCTSSSIVNFQFNTQTNPVAVFKVTPGNGSFVVLASADPGTWTGMYFLAVAAVA